MDKYLTWEDSYEIARFLSNHKPEVNLQDVSLGDILKWTKEIPEFSDDIKSVTDKILMDIFYEWLEEDLQNE